MNAMTPVVQVPELAARFIAKPPVHREAPGSSRSPRFIAKPLSPSRCNRREPAASVDVLARA
jgi:hypothetical protein